MSYQVDFTHNVSISVKNGVNGLDHDLAEVRLLITHSQSK